MRSVGSALMHAGSGVLSGAQWASCDLTSGAALPKADLVIEGYMIGELSESMRLPVARKLWEACGQMLFYVQKAGKTPPSLLQNASLQPLQVVLQFPFLFRWGDKTIQRTGTS